MKHIEKFNKSFKDYNKYHRRPIMEQLEDLLIEVFDGRGICESPNGSSTKYSWWNELDYNIIIGNIPQEDLYWLILDDVYSIRPKIENRLGRKIKITSGHYGGTGKYCIVIEPL